MWMITIALRIKLWRKRHAERARRSANFLFVPGSRFVETCCRGAAAQAVGAGKTEARHARQATPVARSLWPKAEAEAQEFRSDQSGLSYKAGRTVPAPSPHTLSRPNPSYSKRVCVYV